MTQVLTGKYAIRAVLPGPLVTVALIVFAANILGQVPSVRGRAYRGSATVSVATLQVPEQAWKHFEKARTLALKHRSADSERECEKALAIAPSFPAAHILEASQQVLLKEYAAAISNVAAARKGGADGEWEGLILAGAYNGLRRYDDAMTEIQSLQGPEAVSWQAKYEETRAAIGLGDEEKALNLSEELLTVVPKAFPDGFLVRTNALMIAHRWSEAASSLKAYLATPGPQTHREQVRIALAEVTRRLHTEQPLTLASK